MIRKLLTTTAVAMLLTSGVVAQDATTTTANDQTTMSPGMSDILATGYQAADSDNLVSRILGQPVYTSAADDAENIGEINDIVLAEGGDIGAVIIGVGGFLGLGEKNVAVDYSQLQWVVAEDDTERFVLETTADQLAAAPDFVWQDDEPAQQTDTAATQQPADPANPDAAAAGGNTQMAATPAEQNTLLDPNAQPAADADQTAAATQPADQNAMDPNAQAGAETNQMAAATPADPNDPNAVTTGMEAATETAANPDAAPSAFDRNAMQPLGMEALTAENIIGTQVIGPENEAIAEVGDIILTPEGQIDALLVDFGGFLGIGEKRVAVGLDNLEFTTDENGGQYVWLNVTREQLDAAPAYDEATYATDPNQRLVVAPAS